MIQLRGYRISENRRMLSHFLMFSAVITALFITLYLFMFRTLLEKTQAELLSQQTDAAIQVEKLLEEAGDTAVGLTNVKYMDWFMSARHDVDGTYVKRVVAIRNSLPNITLTNQFFGGVYVYSIMNDAVISKQRISMKVRAYFDDMYRFGDENYATWFAWMNDQSAKSFLKKARCVTDYEIGEDCIVYVLPYYCSSQLDFKGRVCFFLRTDAIRALYDSTVDEQSEYVCILDAAGDVLFELGSADLASGISLRDIPEGMGERNLGGRRVSVLKTAANSGLRFVTVLDRKVVDRELRAIRTGFILACAVALILCCVLSFVFSRNSLKRIRGIMGALEKRGYIFSDENELLQLGELINRQDEKNSNIERIIAEKQRNIDRMLFERLAAGEEADPLTLNGLEERHPAAKKGFAYIILHESDAAKDSFYTQELPLSQLPQAGDGFIVCVKIVNNALMWVIFCCADEAAARAGFDTLSDELQKLGLDTSCVVGTLGDSWSDLGQSEESTQYEMMNQKQLSDKVIFCRESSPASEYCYSLDMEKRLTAICFAGNAEEADLFLSELKAQVMSQQAVSPYAVTQLNTGLINTVLRLTREANATLSPEEADDIVAESRRMMKEASVAQLFDFARRSIQRIVKSINSRRRKSEHDRIEEINAYIAAEYGDAQLSISEIAARFNMSENYVSEFYKKVTGVTLAKYIEDVRLEHGRMLLSAGEPVSQVSLMVGYANVNTFRRAYRRKYNVNPSEQYSAPQ